jgi:hypothetical protein
MKVAHFICRFALMAFTLSSCLERPSLRQEGGYFGHMPG